MKFLYPEFLWAFALLIIPIIIHLFNFKRYKTLYFSSLSFVKHVDQNTKSIQKLKHLLILAARLLAFIFLILAFCQPYFSDNEGATDADNPLTVFYIDNSFSMQAKGSEGELLSEARETSRKIINKASLDTRFVIGTNELNGAEERLLSKIEALEKLDKISFSPITRSVSDILRWQSSTLSAEKEQNENIKYILLSDFQRHTSKQKSELMKSGNYYPIKFTPESTSNRYIDSVWFSTPHHKIGTQKELNIKLVNSGDQDLRNVEIDIKIGDYRKTLFVDINKNESTVTQVGYSDKSTGIKQGEIHVVDEGVFFDDTYFLSYEVKEKINILILNGSDAISNFSLVYSLDDYYKVKETELTAITLDDFSDKDLVIVNGANRITNGVTTLFKNYINAGGSISLFPGISPEINGWNNLLNELHLSGIGGNITSGTKIKSLNYSDPFFAGVFEKKTTNLNLPSVKTSFEPRITSRQNSRDLITLNNGLSLLSNSKPNGNAFMFYSSLHPDFGNLSQDALFSTIALRMAELSQRQPPLHSIIGEDSKYPIYSKTIEEDAIHLTNGNIDFIPQSESHGGTRYLSLKRLGDIAQLKANNYDIVLNKKIGVVSLNYNRAESNLESYSTIEIEELLKENGVKNIELKEINGKTSFTTIDIDKPYSFWKICILLSVVFLLLEMALIRFLK